MSQLVIVTQKGQLLSQNRRKLLRDGIIRPNRQKNRLYVEVRMKAASHLHAF